MAFDDIGYEVIDNVLSPDECSYVLSILEHHQLAPLSGGIRRIEKQVPEVAQLAQSTLITSIASSYLTDAPALVRAIYFNKSEENNWLVTWHQDRTVAVSDRFEMEGWEPWSRKADAWHVQPPLKVLESMITIRLHLDPTDRQNGCLKVLPSSHNLGLIKSDKVIELTQGKSPIYCEASAGSALVMRPHILHASEKASVSAPRRILHFEYASYALPNGITWAS